MTCSFHPFMMIPSFRDTDFSDDRVTGEKGTQHSFFSNQ